MIIVTVQAQSEAYDSSPNSLPINDDVVAQRLLRRSLQFQSATMWDRILPIHYLEIGCDDTVASVLVRLPCKPSPHRLDYLNFRYVTRKQRCGRRKARQN